MRTSRLLPQDILDAIAVIERYTPETEASFDADPPVQSHVARHLAIIGEAVARLPKDLKDANPQIPWRVIEDMRNILVHAYFSNQLPQRSTRRALRCRHSQRPQRRA